MVKNIILNSAKFTVGECSLWIFLSARTKSDYRSSHMWYYDVMVIMVTMVTIVTKDGNYGNHCYSDVMVTIVTIVT